MNISATRFSVIYLHEPWIQSFRVATLFRTLFGRTDDSHDHPTLSNNIKFVCIFACIVIKQSVIVICRYGLCRPVSDIPECSPGEVARKQYNGVRDIGYLKYTQVTRWLSVHLSLHCAIYTEKNKLLMWKRTYLRIPKFWEFDWILWKLKPWYNKKAALGTGNQCFFFKSYCLLPFKWSTWRILRHREYSTVTVSIYVI